MRIYCVKLSVAIKEWAPTTMVQSQLNNVIRDSLSAAGIYWIENFLPLHFNPGAVQRYGYEARTEKYNAIKRSMKRVRPWLTGGVRGPWQAAPKPPAPLVWAGTLRDNTINRPSHAYNIKAVSTRNVAECRVPVPLPHPMRGDNAAEVVSVIQSEFDKLHQVAVTQINKRFVGFMDTTATKTIDEESAIIYHTY